MAASSAVRETLEGYWTADESLLVTATDRSIELVNAAALAAADRLAHDIIAYDVSDVLSITDAFLLASAPNDRQVKSIVDEIEERLNKDLGAKPVRREGDRDARWILLDYVDIVVHVQHSEERVFYALERLWKDCPELPLPEEALKTRGKAAVVRRVRHDPALRHPVDGEGDRGHPHLADRLVTEGLHPGPRRHDVAAPPEPRENGAGLRQTPHERLPRGLAHMASVRAPQLGHHQRQLLLPVDQGARRLRRREERPQHVA
ncbi:Ribosomal silencing factor RsfS [Streptomyces narbonensis]